ncbi:MAG: hypothetical protein KF745_03620 [Phycisphaeraceae bacterium]|nr:hypothetical protein [Phycisphaeraceae bacterium]
MRFAAAALALTCAAVIFASPAPASAQDRLAEMAPAVEWSTLGPTEAAEEAARQNRLLVLYQYEPNSADAAWMEQYTWRNPTLAAYIRWHCIAVKVPAPCTGVSIFKGKKCMKRLYCEESPYAANEGMLPSALTSGRKIPKPPKICPGAVSILFQSDFAMERIRSTDPVWYEFHNLKNPPPEPPPMPTGFYAMDDGLGESVRDPGPEDGPVDLWQRLDDARRAVRVGNLYAATGLYTWLWERAAELDPAFGPARRGALASEIADLASRRPGAKERFTQIRDARSARMLWADYDEMVEWGVLGSMVADDELVVEWFNMVINSDAEAAMMPRADKIAYNLMLARERLADSYELGKDPVGRISRIAAIAAGARPRNVQPEDWPGLQAFVRTYLVDEACRLHAACLRAGREGDAWQIADLLLKQAGTPLARRSLVTTALVAGQPRQRHAAILGEADNDLRARLAAALNPPVVDSRDP